MLIQPGGIVPCLITSSMAISMTGRTLGTVKPNLSLFDSRSGKMRMTLKGIRPTSRFCCGPLVMVINWVVLLFRSVANGGSSNKKRRAMAQGRSKHLAGLPFPLFGTSRRLIAELGFRTGFIITFLRCWMAVALIRCSSRPFGRQQ